MIPGFGPFKRAGYASVKTELDQRFTSESISSKALTGTRKSFPIRMVGISPRLAAS
jgi:hypothetical protein